MEITENMFYGIGQVALAIALADGKVDKEEIKSLNKRIMEIGERSDIDLSLVESTFLQHSKTTSFSTKELLDEGIRNFHLGDSHLTPQLADLFLEILLETAKAKGGVDKKEKEIFNKFVQYLADRKRQAENREKGYTKDVMIPVDFSGVSTKIVSQVDQLEHWLHAGFRVTLLHCISPEEIHGNGKTFEEMKTNAINKLESLVSRYMKNKKLKDMIRIEVINERLEYLHQEYISENDIDLVIMGTHGKDEEDYLGATHTAEHIQRHFANYIVLPEKVAVEPINKVAVCTDFDYDSFQQFGLAKEFAQLNKAHVTLVYAGEESLSTQQEHKRKELMQYFNTEDIQRLALNESVHREIIDYSATQLYDLLVVLPKHTSFFQKFDGHQSIVKQMVQFTQTPLLVLNGKNQTTQIEELILEIL